MPISVTTDYTPAPHAEITITSADGSAITAASLYRVTGSLRELTRVQPGTGTASQYVEDYALDWDTPVTYQVSVTYNSGASTSTYTSTVVTITSTQAFAIHPTNPPLSLPIDSASTTVIGVASLGDITWAANRTLHTVLDNPYPVPSITGNRAAAAGQITLSTTTAAEQNALRAILNDHTPLLIRVPDSYGWDWEDGYYDIGDVTAGRPLMYGGDPHRTFTLPYQRVASPAGGQQSAWSYPQLIAAYADYPTLRATYDDYPSVVGDNRG